MQGSAYLTLRKWLFEHPIDLFFWFSKKKIDPFFFFAMDRDQICGGYLRFIIAQLADKLQETASP